jgi:hypothetical protein
MRALPNFEALVALLRIVLVLLVLVLGMPAARAHKASDAYLTLTQRGGDIVVRWDVALRDLDVLVAIDTNDDARITWGELKASQPEIESHLLSQWSMRAQGTSGGAGVSTAADCVFQPEHQGGIKHTEPALERRVDGTYYVFKMRAACPSANGRFELRYHLMRGVDPTHRGLLQLAGQQGGLVSLSPTTDGLLLTLQVEPAGAATTAGSLRQWWQDGVHHILIGTDHLLFLLCLLLPAVLQREPLSDGRFSFSPVGRWQLAISPVLMTITMFTLAHSATLALAGFKLITVPPSVIEPAIALTIAMAAVDNIHPILRGRRYLFTFLFGLVHGFGFAGVLAEMDLPLSGFAGALLAFNLGVESGQLAIVLPVLALLLWVRGHAWYSRQVVPAASIVAMVISLGWFVERAFDLGFMPI